MKFFKCLSQNVSLVQDTEECAMKRPSKLSFKKKKRSCANEQGTPIPRPRKRFGLPARFAFKEKNQPRSEEAPLVKDTKSGIDNPVDPADKTYTVHDPVWQLPGEEPFQTELKTQKYLSSQAACKQVLALNCESDESSGSFSSIYDTDGNYFLDRSLTPLHRNVPKRPVTDRPRFLERFPEDVLNNGSIFYRSYSEDMSQLSINGNPQIVQGSPTGSQSYGDVSIDVEGLHETVTSIGSGRLDPVVTCPDRLFKDAYDSQVVDRRSPAGRRKIVVTIVRSEGRGFGLVLFGECPPKIIVVERGSPADCAGIKPHDMLVKINGHRMHSATAEKAGRLLRTIDEPYLLLEIHRPSKESLDKADMRRRLARARAGFPETDTEDDTDDDAT